MTLALLAIISGLILLAVSAEHFVKGAASIAKYFNMSPMLIGILIVGFGTSAPEMLVSALSAFKGSSGIALGNAYGSNITNIALILGLTALVCPIMVNSTVLRKELPTLTAVTILSIFLIYDLELSRWDSIVLLIVFTFLLIWTIRQSLNHKKDFSVKEMKNDMVANTLPAKQATVSLLGGFILLVFSSKILVWGAIELAQIFGISDTIIGLTIVSLGTSLPELASTLTATRRGEHDIAFGNIIGSNLFNTLVVVGITGIIHPCQIESVTLTRDIALMSILTISIFIIGYGFNRRKGCINRYEGAGLLIIYIAYNAYLINTIVAS